MAGMAGLPSIPMSRCSLGCCIYLPSFASFAAPRQSRVCDLVAARRMDHEIATALNAEGLLSAHGRPLSGDEVHLLRKRWSLPTVKINGTEHNPLQWPDGTYSVQGAAAALSISPQTVSNGCRKVDCRATSWPKECPGRSPFRPCRSPN